MKTSNKILAGLLTFVLLLVIGANLVLKAEYEKLDFKDPFYGYDFTQTPAFKAVRVEGNMPGSVRLQPGLAFELRTKQKLGGRVVQSLEGEVKWHLQGDTLVLHYASPDSSGPMRINWYPTPETALRSPVAYVIAPSLQAVRSESVTVLTDWQEPEMDLTVTGRHLILDHNTISRLSIRTSQACATDIKPSNQIESVLVTLRDSSSLQVKKDMFTSVRLQASPQASVNVPVSVLHKISEQPLP